MKLSTGVHSIYSTLIFIGLVLGMQACGGSSAPPPPADANPVGYYAGTLSTTTPSNVDVSAKAIVDSDKFMLVHINNAGSNTLLYVGTFTDITVTTFTADVRIYRDGAFERTATITNGSITERSSMSGTLSGTGNYTATAFSLTYDTTINTRTPLVSVVTDKWLAPTTANTGFLFTQNSPTEITNAYDNIAIVPNALKGCRLSGIRPINVNNSEQVGRIRTYTANYPIADSCVNFVAPFSMIAYMTPFDNAGNDNRYLWITYNANNFFADELVKQ